jgi:hypothetical protein
MDVQAMLIKRDQLIRDIADRSQLALDEPEFRLPEDLCGRIQEYVKNWEGV